MVQNNKLICTNRVNGLKAFVGVAELKAKHEDAQIDDYRPLTTKHGEGVKI